MYVPFNMCFECTLNILSRYKPKAVKNTFKKEKKSRQIKLNNNVMLNI